MEGRREGEKMLSREEIEKTVGAIKIVGADGCIGYYVVAPICGIPVIWEGKKAFDADWDGYGRSWKAYLV